MMAKGARRRSAYFICAPKRLGVAEIGLGADARRRAARPRAPGVAHPVAVHDGDDDGAVGLGLAARVGPLARSAASRRSTPMRHARRGHRLAGEALDEVVVAPAARDRAELARLAVVAQDLEGQLGLEDGAGVVAEAADDRGVEDHAVRAVAAGVEQGGDLLQLLDALRTRSPSAAAEVARARASVAAPVSRRRGDRSP